MRLTIRNSDGSVSQPTNATIESVFERLAEYEDSEEDGRLVTLPIKIDGRAWMVRNGAIKPVRVTRYSIGHNVLGDTVLIAHVECLSPMDWVTINADYLYSTQEQADEALKGAENGDIN